MIEAQHLGGGRLVHAGKLRAVVDVDGPIRVPDENRIERLHRSVRQERKNHLGLDRLDPGLGKCLVHVATLRRLYSLLGEFGREIALEFGTGAFFRLGQIPFDLEGGAATQGSECVVRQNGDALRNLLDVHDACHFSCFAVVEGFDGGAEMVGVSDDRNQHVVGKDVEREDGLSGALGETVQPRHDPCR